MLTRRALLVVLTVFPFVPKLKPVTQTYAKGYQTGGYY